MFSRMARLSTCRSSSTAVAIGRDSLAQRVLYATRHAPTEPGETDGAESEALAADDAADDDAAGEGAAAAAAAAADTASRMAYAGTTSEHGRRHRGQLTR